MNNIDLASLTLTQGFKISGAAADDGTGYSVSSAGDINGDGIDDLVVGAPLADPSGRSNAGATYVIYGKSGGLSNIDLASLTTVDGFKISGAAAEDYTGVSVSSAGDINGDGIDDLVVGARGADPSSRADAGAAYVIYGKSGGLSDIDLLNLTTVDGFKISGAAAEDYTGISVSNAGDINDDGIADLIIGAYRADPSGRNKAGAAYVIYGKNGGLSDIDLLNLTAVDGFKISGVAAGSTGYSVSSAGDINGDEIDDLVVGAPDDASSSGISDAGAAYVIYGKNGGLNDIDLLNLTAVDGFKISGAAEGDWTGWSVSNAGDINGDGIVDIVVGVPTADPSGRADAGAAYVIYGKSGGLSNIDLASLTSTQGFKISGAAAVDGTGCSVSNAGDINGDGIVDIVVGVPTADPSGRADAGAAYVIYGKNGGLNDIDLASLSAVDGFKISGAAANDRTGESVSSGDINGDGIDDLVVGAPYADPYGRDMAGAAYVIYGTGNSENNPPTISDFTKTSSEGVTVTFSVSDFTSHYNDIDGDPLAKIQIVGLSKNGLLELSRVDVTLNQEILPDNLGSLTFSPNSDWHGETSVSWKASDGSLYSDTADVSLSITEADPDPDDSAAAVYGGLSTFLVGAAGLFLAEVLL